MATISYLLKGKDNPATIYLRFRAGRQHDYTKSTGWVIDPKDWSNKKKAPLLRSPDLKNLATDLKNLEASIIEHYNNTDGNEIHGDWLSDLISRKNGGKNLDKDEQLDESVIGAINRIIENASTRENSTGGLGLSTSRVNSYKNLRNIIEDFQGRKKLLVKEVNLKLGRDFLRFLMKDKQYAESYARKKVDDLKAVCRDARLYGVATHPQLDAIRGGKPKNKYILYLSPEELEKIEAAELPNQHLDNARRWLLLGCELGQRGNDLLRLNEENFYTDNGFERIELVQEKTDKQVVIPISPLAKRVLSKGFPSSISIQKFNTYIKDVCQIAGITEEIEGSKYEIFDSAKGKAVNRTKRKVTGIYQKWQLITSHCCRRSFATNYYGKMPTILLMQITAHQTEKMFLNYIGKTSMDYAKMAQEYYKSINLNINY
ncbi:MAG: integrase [Maribacter sp.]|nr:integrase [Maribacter sp.]